MPKRPVPDEQPEDAAAIPKKLKLEASKCPPDVPIAPSDTKENNAPEPVASAEVSHVTRGVESLPFDILVEIASHLSPADLLALGDTSRTLRRTLIAKDSAPIWRAARRADEIPDAPEDLTEQHFAVLLFGEACVYCAEKGPIMILEQRLRLCQHCYDSEILETADIEELCGTEEDVSFADLFPFTMHTQNDDGWDTDSDDESPPELRVGCWSEVRCLEVVEEYLSYPPDSEQRQDFLQARKAFVKQTLEHAKVVNIWCSRRQFRHRQGINDRLKALGYSDSDLSDWGDSKAEERWWDGLIRDYRPLTTTRWERILPGLKSCIQSRRDTKERRELAHEYFGGDQERAEEELINVEYEDDYYDSDDLGYNYGMSIEEAMSRNGYGHLLNWYAMMDVD